MKIKKAEELFKEGKIEEAISYLDTFINKHPSQKEKILEAKLLKAQILYRTSQFDEAKEISNQVQDEALNSGIYDIVVESCITLSYLYLTLGELEEAISIIEEGFESLKRIEKDSDLYLNLKAQLFSRRGTVVIEKGDFDQALKYFNKSLPLFEKINDIAGKTNILYNIGLAYNIKGDHENAIKYLEKTKKIQEEQENYYGMAYSLMEIGGTYQREGKLEKALECFKKMAHLFKKYGNKKNIAWSYTDLGNIYQDLGEITMALKYYQKALPIYEELNDKRTLANHLRSMASAYRTKGEFLVSVDFNRQAIKLYEEIENKPYAARGYLNLAEDYHILGNYEKAEDFYKKSLKIFQSEKNQVFLAPNLFQLIQLYLELDEKNKALNYYRKLKEISFARENKLFNQLQNLAHGLILRKENRLIEKGKAQQIFRTISKEELTNHKYKVIALLALSESLLLEVKLFNNKLIFDEFIQKVNDLFSIADKQHSYSLKAKTHLLNSQVYLLKFDIQRAKEQLDKALRIAEDKGYQYLSIQISRQYDQLLDKENQWNKLIKENKSLKETIEYSGIEELIESMIKIKQEQTKVIHETPVYLSIITEDGLSVYSKQFKESLSIDEQLVGGFLSALKSFAKETFSSAGDIDRIKFKDNSLILRVFEPVVLCYVFKGESYLASLKTKKIIETIQRDEYLWKRLNEAVKNSEIPDNEIFDPVISSHILQED
ncbi:MAG: putative Photosystem I assembly protein Ycf3 [Promethearchaeota archaeon]|nr:MAG: putative Photosystem I assembly protein Ycf3 [Candidatus Lokiarchaeota archaeon]